MTAANIDEVELPETRKARVEVQRFRPNYENPDLLPRREAVRIKRDRQSGVWFLNPVTVVHTPEESENHFEAGDEFVRTALKAQASWYRLLNKAVGKGWRRKRQLETDRMAQAFEYDGVIITKGATTSFNLWRHSRDGRLKRLITIERRPEGLTLVRDQGLTELRDVQKREVEGIRHTLVPADELTHFVLPHLTLSSQPNDVFWKEVTAEQANWRNILRRSFGSRCLNQLPDDIRDGQILAGGELPTAASIGECDRSRKRRNSSRLV